MKRKLLLGGLTGLLVLGGAVGVGAFSDNSKNDAGQKSNFEVNKDDWGDDKGSDRSLSVGRDDDSNQVQNRKGIISEAEAIAIATKETPGNVVEVELDDDHYEIEIKNGHYETEYKIDAYTGKILEKDVDQDDSRTDD